MNIGIDIGSRFTKIAVWHNGAVVDTEKRLSGTDPEKTAINLIVELEDRFGEKSTICATGYGRKILRTKYLSEIMCHAKGVHYLIPSARTIIDIGGQDSKVISISKEGKVVDFAMNDKCAAGTGSFLEKIASLCGLEIAQLGETALKSNTKLDISSTCVVFAESEIITLINRKVPLPDILMGVHISVAKRIKNLLSSINMEEPLILTGGAALNTAMKKALELELNVEIIVPEIPIYTGALGAAIYSLT